MVLPHPLRFDDLLSPAVLVDERDAVDNDCWLSCVANPMAENSPQDDSTQDTFCW
jgi:hypothetical protein